MSLIARSKAPTKRFAAGSNHHVYTILSPAINNSLSFAAICHQAIHATTVFIFVKAYTISDILLRNSFYATNIILRQSFYSTQILLTHSYYALAILSQGLYWASIKAAYTSQILLTQTYYGLALLSQNLYWASVKTFWYLWIVTDKPRRKVAYEFAAFLLGGGNGLVLLAFWPGWLLIGGSVLLVWYLTI